MLKTKLTVRVDPELLENVKKFASRNNTTLTELIDSFFRQIPVQGSLKDAPTVRYLTGVLSANSSADDYKAHLDEKYGG
jgi:hypothetical protein